MSPGPATERSEAFRQPNEPAEAGAGFLVVLLVAAIVLPFLIWNAYWEGKPRPTRRY
jgi:hypothetical protein